MPHTNSFRNRKRKSKAARIRRNFKISDRSQLEVSRVQHQISPPLIPYNSKTISSKKYSIVDPKTSTTVGNLYPRFLETEVAELDYWIQHSGSSISKITRDCRGEHRTVSLGIWVTRYTNRIKPTPQSGSDLAGQFILDFEHVWDKISDKVIEDWQDYAEDVSRLPKQYRPFNLFSFLVCNISQIKKVHRDWNDHNLCVVIPTSDFEGGELFFPYMNIKIQARKGDMIIFDSRAIWHGVLESFGQRRSIVLTTHNSLFRVLGL